jgi:hypothetical protein
LILANDAVCICEIAAAHSPKSENEYRLQSNDRLSFGLEYMYVCGRVIIEMDLDREALRSEYRRHFYDIAKRKKTDTRRRSKPVANINALHGGDPLAALAAGETPSSEMVALRARKKAVDGLIFILIIERPPTW